MKTSCIIVDNFYNNVDAVRSLALSSDFNVEGNYPGKRTIPFINDSTKATIERIMVTHGGRVVDWSESSGYTGAFQYCTEEDSTWIHVDGFNGWAAVCYLTPNAPTNSGTALYKHKPTNLYSSSTNDGFDPYREEEWEMTDYISNRYNRLVIYPGSYFHKAAGYFGSDKYNGRLFQTFFFNTEY